MPDLPRPYLLIHGQRLLPEGQDGNTAPVAALADLSIKWGQETITDEPKPATLSVTLRYRGSVDVLKVTQGDLIEVQQVHPDDERVPFSGRVRNMSASLDAKGRLLLRITATDHLSDLDSTYVSTAWHTDGQPEAGGITIRQHIETALTNAGWALSGLDLLPAELGPSVATFYSSIKLTTLLRRYLAQWGPQATYYDASYTDATTGKLRRRVAISYMADTAPGDTLTAPGGTWTIQYGEPEPLQEVAIPARNVLRDVDWDSSPENLITAAQVSRQVTRLEEYEDGTTGYVTSLSEVNVTRGAEWIDQYGNRAIELETVTGRPSAEALHRAIGRKWMAFNGDEWRPSGITIHKSNDLPAQQLSDMVGKTTRQRQWVVVPGVQVMTPRGASAALRGLTTGGTLNWNHDRNQWDITMALADTQATTDMNWTFTMLSNVPDNAYRYARADQAGTVQFSAFRTISTIGATT